MASLVKMPWASVLRSAAPAQAVRCSCSMLAVGAGGRRFLATAVEGSALNIEAATTAPAATPSGSQHLDSVSSMSKAVLSAASPRPQPPSGIQSRRAPQPIPAAQQEEAQQIYLPNMVFRLVRNSPREQNNPFIATFRVPVQLTKPDIVSYLWQVYGLKVTSISTITEMGDKVRMRPGRYVSERRMKNTKKAIVGMEEPFWFPEKRPESWLRDNFEKAGRADSLAKRLLPVGDGGPGRGRRSFRWRGASATKQGVGARYSEIVKRLQERRSLQEEQVASLVRKEKAGVLARLRSLKAQ